MNFSQKVANLKKFSRQLSELVSTYMSFILVLIFLVPWISGKIKLHNSDAVVTLVEVFVLSSATLSLLTFTYISGMSDLHEKIKKSMIVAGESFFVATVQFIVGLSLFLLVTLIINHFMDPSALTLNFIDPSEISMNLDLNGIVYVILFFIQLMGIYEIASALSKFLKGIFEVYKSFRVKKLKGSRLYSLCKYVGVKYTRFKK